MRGPSSSRPAQLVVVGLVALVITRALMRVHSNGPALPGWLGICITVGIVVVLVLAGGLLIAARRRNANRR